MELLVAVARSSGLPGELFDRVELNESVSLPPSTRS
jgi:hypothetical protein